MPYRPYGRRSVFRKGKRVVKRRRRPAPINSWKAAAHLAKKAWSGIKYLKGLVNVEKHKFDTAFSIPFTNTGTVSGISSIPQGDAEGTRSGNSILAKYAYLSFNCTRNAASTTVSDLIRMVVLVDSEQASDTSPTFTQIFESATPLALLNKLFVGRFTILYDKTFNLTANTPYARINQMIPLNFHIRYNGASSVDYEKNGVYLVTIADSASNLPALVGTTRLAYYDN